MENEVKNEAVVEIAYISNSDIAAALGVGVVAIYNKDYIYSNIKNIIYPVLGALFTITGMGIMYASNNGAAVNEHVGHDHGAGGCCYSPVCAIGKVTFGEGFCGECVA